MKRALAASETANHYDGAIIANFGLGMHAWQTGDRKLAAAHYSGGVAMGKAAKSTTLGFYAKSKLDACQENLLVLRGELGGGRSIGPF